ncbi:hypothetical protein BDN72DRAFT_907124, partial [Pluteus cervinus]
MSLRPFTAYTAGDGLVGCLLGDGTSFITSPNCSKIYQPQLGGDRTVYMRVNLRYGADDPLQWPQPYIPKFAHHVAIRTPVKDPADPLSLAWWLPEKKHFVQDSNCLFGGLGRLDPNILLPLQHVCELLLRRVSRSEKKSATPLVGELSTLLSDFLDRVKHLSTDFDTLLLLIRGLQRIYLELLALMDFLEVYQPRMEGIIPHSARAIAPVMGCFANSHNDAEMMLRAGIRVWLVRPSEQVPSARIRKVVSMHRPEGLLPLEAHKRTRWTYRGANSDADKNSAIFRELTQILTYPNIFASTKSPDEANLPPPEPPQPKKISFNPYPKTKKKKPSQYGDHPASVQKTHSNYSSATNPGGRDKFAEPACQFFPPPIEPWKTALSAVEHPVQSNLTAVWGYILPEPAGLIAVQNPERQRSMFQFWLKFRSAFIYQATSSRTGATPNSATFWRKLLGQDFEKAGPPPVSNGTKTSKLRDCVQDYIAKCVDNVNLTCTDSSQLSLLPMNTVPAVWLGTPSASLESAHLEQILWELTELNFRFELVAMDNWAHEPKPQQSPSDPPPADRQGLVEACFWGV